MFAWSPEGHSVSDQHARHHHRGPRKHPFGFDQLNLEDDASAAVGNAPVDVLAFDLRQLQLQGGASWIDPLPQHPQPPQRSRHQNLSASSTATTASNSSNNSANMSPLTPSMEDHQFVDDFVSKLLETEDDPLAALEDGIVSFMDSSRAVANGPQQQEVKRPLVREPGFVGSLGEMRRAAFETNGGGESRDFARDAMLNRNQCPPPLPNANLQSPDERRQLNGGNMMNESPRPLTGNTRSPLPVSGSSFFGGNGHHHQ